MANFTSLEQAQIALNTVNNNIDELVAKRSDAIAARAAASDTLSNYQNQMRDLLAIKEKSSFFSAEYMKATADANALAGPFSNAQRALTAARSNFNAANEAVSQAESEKAQIEKSISQFETPGDVITDVTAVNDDPDATAALDKQRDATVNDVSDPYDYRVLPPDSNGIGLRGNLSVPLGAEPQVPQAASVNFVSMSSTQVNKDMRVKIRVPPSYLTSLTSGPNLELKALGGVIFPYTPQISYDHTAEYGTQNPMHSNYTVYFYKHSKISPIKISGLFTVQNETDAAIYLATVHLLRSLTKMRSGGATGDFDSGAPPPVCRLDAYGAFMLQNVPVVITQFSLDLPDNIDYFTFGKESAAARQQSTNFEQTAVPVHSKITVTCLPVYSRNEMQKFNVTQWNQSKYVRKAGYL